MEDRTTTDATLRIYRELHEKHGNLGVVFQAYMRRTLDDIAAMPAESPNVRLCKGIYIEPRTAAWKGHATVRLNYVRALDKIFRQGIYAGIATHDDVLIEACTGLLRDKGIAPSSGQYEYQMLLGVRPRLRAQIVAARHPLRVYVPFGDQWYAYSVRRLRENPEIAGHVVRALLRGEGLRKSA